MLGVYPEEVLSLRGKVLLKSLQGSFDILGFTLKPDSQHLPVYSPDCASAVSITGLENDAAGLNSDLDSKIDQCFDEGDADKVKKFCTDHRQCCILLLHELEDKMCDFVQGISPFESLFRIGKSEGPGSVLLEGIGVEITTVTERDQIFQASHQYRSLAARLCKDIENGEFLSEELSEMHLSMCVH